MKFEHSPVLLTETVAGLNIKSGDRSAGVYVDCTCGGGGHSFEICKRLSSGRLYALDRDTDALDAAREKLSQFEFATLFHTPFSRGQEVLLAAGVSKVDGVLMDLGVSSHQFDEGGRGFSYRYDAPLDMRMDTSDTTTAFDVVNGYDESLLRVTLKIYGEEKFAARIARNICDARASAPIRTTFELAEIVKKSYPAAVLRKQSRERGNNPCKKTFQALRMEVNDEFHEIQAGISGMFELLKSGGRMCVITFHSVEDRIVKDYFRRYATACTCPRELPCVCGGVARGVLVNKKPITASEEELRDNNRARSAKLRVIEKV